MDQQTAKIQFENHAKLKEEKIKLLETQANQRILEILELKNKENRSTNIKTQFEIMEQERQAREEYRQKLWSAEDEVRKHKLEILKKQTAKESEYESELLTRANAETQIRILHVKENLQLVNIEKSRKLRELEEEILLKENQYKRESAMRVEALKAYEQ